MNCGYYSLALLLAFFSACQTSQKSAGEQDLHKLLDEMSTDEKIGQLTLVNGEGGKISPELRAQLENGQIGAILNEVDKTTVDELQQIAVENSPHGIPLLFGRDVIHGFRTILPIPIAQAATWNPDLVERGARVAAAEAARSGVNWTFSPMVDVSRDPRWGRMIESYGEDPLLNARMGAASVKGYQGDDLTQPDKIAACAKHFAGYGAPVGGTDYNTVHLPMTVLRNVILPPFKACVDAGVASVMSGFHEIDGTPVTGSHFFQTEILREEWGFDGFVTSDWASVEELAVHGVTEGDRGSAKMALHAGIDMEMATQTYRNHVADLIESGELTLKELDHAVLRILRIKKRLGLFENPIIPEKNLPEYLNDRHLETAYQAALQSCVLLKNQNQTLPLDPDRINRLAVIGYLAADPYEMMGAWTFDGQMEDSHTALQAIREWGEENFEVTYAPGLETTRDQSTAGFAQAKKAAQNADAVLLFVGEEAILNGEAHTLADISLKGAQKELVQEIAKTGKPLILVIMAGRPLTIQEELEASDAVLYAWHPGTMGGPAIADLIFGKASPSGKLPVTFPKMVGQVPIYYAHKNTGKPVENNRSMRIDEIPVRAIQYNFIIPHHLDAGEGPLFPFGYGLSYGAFTYSDLNLSKDQITLEDSLEIRVTLKNSGNQKATEVAQLYVRDMVASITRPVRELKDFQRIELAPGESKEVVFVLHPSQLGFYIHNDTYHIEPGEFKLWVGGDSNADLGGSFILN